MEYKLTWQEFTHYSLQEAKEDAIVEFQLHLIDKCGIVNPPEAQYITVSEKLVELDEIAEFLKAKMQEILELDGSDDNGVHDEWGEAHCFWLAQKIAKEALDKLVS